MTHGSGRTGPVCWPEWPLAGFGILLHFAWEMMQVPWFEGMTEASHGAVVWLCTRATLGDVVIGLAAFWIACVVAGDRQWIVQGRRTPLLVMLFTGVVVTLAFEWLATGPLERWQYAEPMPIIPIVGVGLTPLLQWLLLPPLIVWLSRRHMIGSGILSMSRAGDRLGQAGSHD